MFNRINGFVDAGFRSKWHALVSAIVRNPFRFRCRARSVVVVESNNYERHRPHRAIISRRSPVSTAPSSTTTARSLTLSNTDQVRLRNRKLVLFVRSTEFFLSVCVWLCDFLIIFMVKKILQSRNRRRQLVRLVWIGSFHHKLQGDRHRSRQVLNRAVCHWPFGTNRFRQWWLYHSVRV